LQKGFERFGSDEESYLQVLRSYAINTRPLLDSVRLVTSHTLAEYAIKVHGIKGASYGVGAQVVGDKANSLELAAKSGDIGFVNDNNRDFIDSAEKLLTDLDHMLGRVAADTVRLEKERPDRDVLARLLEACKAYDMDAMDTAVAELENYAYATGGELVPWLRENVQQLNTKQIIIKLSGLPD